MNEKQAEAIGLGFTGIFSFNKEEMKQKAIEIRKKYPKAKCRVITEKHNPLSGNSHGDEYSIYCDNVYFAYLKVERLQQIITDYPNKRKFLIEKQQKELLNSDLEFSNKQIEFVEAKKLIAKANKRII